MKYGTLPIARSSAGLSATVLDRDHPDRPVMQRSGSVFDQPGQTPALESAMTPAIGRCLPTIPPGFRPLMLAAMRQDYARAGLGEDDGWMCEYLRRG